MHRFGSRRLARPDDSSLTFTYDKAHNLTQLTTPAGTLITYTRDGVGRIVKVTAQRSGQAARTVVSNVTYNPFGPAAGIVFGNGRTLTRSYDRNDFVTAIGDGMADGLNLSFGHNAIGQFTRISSGTSGNTGNKLIYDALGRLTHVNDLGNVGQWRYSYDATGNRLTQQAGTGAVSKYTYPTDSHHLLALGPVGAEVLRGYDAMGNTTTIGSGATAQAFHYRTRTRTRTRTTIPITPLAR